MVLKAKGFYPESEFWKNTYVTLGAYSHTFVKGTEYIKVRIFQKKLNKCFVFVLFLCKPAVWKKDRLRNKWLRSRGREGGPAQTTT